MCSTNWRASTWLGPASADAFLAPAVCRAAETVLNKVATAISGMFFLPWFERPACEVPAFAAAGQNRPSSGGDFGRDVGFSTSSMGRNAAVSFFNVFRPRWPRGEIHATAGPKISTSLRRHHRSVRVRPLQIAMRSTYTEQPDRPAQRPASPAPAYPNGAIFWHNFHARPDDRLVMRRARSIASVISTLRPASTLARRRSPPRETDIFSSSMRPA